MLWKYSFPLLQQPMTKRLQAHHRYLCMTSVASFYAWSFVGQLLMPFYGLFSAPPQATATAEESSLPFGVTLDQSRLR